MTLLLQWLWQGTALALGVAALLHYMTRINAATRYAVWWLALAATVLLPFAGFLSSALDAAMALRGDAGAHGVPGFTPSGIGHSGQPWLTVPAVPDWLIACAVGTWFGSVIVGSARLVAGIRTVQRLKRESRPMPAGLTRLRHDMPGQQVRHQAVRGVELRTSPAVSGACALGLAGRPAVVIGDRLLTALDAEALDLIVMHELMHLRRYDDWSRVVQSCVVVLVGFHPAVRFICHHIDLEREAACDEAVAVHSGQPRRYAASLAAVADLIGGTPRVASAALIPNAMGAGSLLARVHRLLDPRQCRHASLQASALAGALLLLTTAVAGAAYLDPVVHVGTPVELQTAAAEPMVQPLLDRRVVARDGLLALPPARNGVVRARLRFDRIDGQNAMRPGAAMQPAELAGDRPIDQFDSTVRVATQPSPEPEPPLVPARPLQFTLALAAFPGKIAGNRETSGDNGWTVAGVPMRRAGLAIGGYFSRAGKAVAGQF